MNLQEVSRAWKKAYIKFSPNMTFIREKPNDRRHQLSSLDNERSGERAQEGKDYIRPRNRTIPCIKGL